MMLILENMNNKRWRIYVSKKREDLYSYGVDLKFIIKDKVTLELKAQKISDDVLTHRILECIETYAISEGRE